jgi:uncharacterized membrane protein
MADTRNVWMMKTIAIALGLSFLTTAVVIAVQLWLTGRSHGAIAGGVAGGVAAVVFMQRNRQWQKDNANQPKA